MKENKEYQERVIEEKRELDNKLTKLDAFIDTQTFTDLPTAEQVRLVCQASYMRRYSEAL